MFNKYWNYFKIYIIFKLFFLKTKLIKRLFNQTLGKRIAPELEYTFGMLLKYIKTNDVYLSEDSKLKISKALNKITTKDYTRFTKSMLLPLPISFNKFVNESGKGFNLFIRTSVDDSVPFTMITKLNRQKHPYISYFRYLILACKEQLMYKLLLSLTKDQFNLLYRSQTKRCFSRPTYGKQAAFDGWFNNELSHYGARDQAFSTKDKEKYLK